MFSGFEAFLPLEEEDESVNIRLDFVDQFVIFHTVDFFDLDGRSANFLDQLSENSRVWFDRAPLIEHEIYNWFKISNLNKDYEFHEWFKRPFLSTGCRIPLLKPVHRSRSRLFRSFLAMCCHQSVLPNPWRLFWGLSMRWNLNQSNSTCLLVIESDENLVNFFSWLVAGGSGGHHFEEFIEFDQTTAVLIEFSDHLIDSLGLGFDTEWVNGDFEFWVWKISYILGQWLLPNLCQRDQKLSWFRGLPQQCSIR